MESCLQHHTSGSENGGLDEVWCDYQHMLCKYSLYAIKLSRFWSSVLGWYLWSCDLLPCWALIAVSWYIFRMHLRICYIILCSKWDYVDPIEFFCSLEKALDATVMINQGFCSAVQEQDVYSCKMLIMQYPWFNKVFWKGVLINASFNYWSVKLCPMQDWLRSCL